MPVVIRLPRSCCSVAGIGRIWPAASGISSSGIGNGQPTRPHSQHTPQTLPRLLPTHIAITTRSGGRQPTVAVATHRQRKTNSSRIASVRIRSGGRQPAGGLVTQLQRRSGTDDRLVAPIDRITAICRCERIPRTRVGLHQSLRRSVALAVEAKSFVVVLVVGARE